MVKTATATKSAGKRRGRPAKADSKPSQYAGTVSNAIREQVRNFIGVCESCGHTLKPVQPIANQIGIAPVILAKFIRGEAGVSMETLDRLAGYVQEHENDAPEDEAETDAAEAPAEA